MKMKKIICIILIVCNISLLYASGLPEQNETINKDKINALRYNDNDFDNIKIAMKSMSINSYFKYVLMKERVNSETIRNYVISGFLMAFVDLLTIFLFISKIQNFSLSMVAVYILILYGPISITLYEKFKSLRIKIPAKYSNKIRNSRAKTLALSYLFGKLIVFVPVGLFCMYVLFSFIVPHE